MFEQKSILRVVLLHLVAILFVILNVSDIRIAGLSHVIPLLDLMIIFYFSVFKNTFGIWFIFLLGIWNDALNGNPLGTTAICYILLVKVFSVLNQKMVIKENFRQVWQQFIAFCFLFLLMKWLILSALSGQFISVTGALVQLVLSSCLYVLMHKFFDHLSHKLLEEN
jgi:rod shape-determining protein MreD